MWTLDSPGSSLGLKKTQFGTLPNGSKVDIYTLKNSRGLVVTILTYGGVIQSIVLPDKNGTPGDITLGFDTLKDYINRSPYFGAIIGRYANRVAKGRFTLNGVKYQIPVNDGPHALHGGPEGFDKKLWDAKPIEEIDRVGVELAYLSPDREMGFPGNLAVTVLYTLNDENELRLEYSAVTDKETVLNLTNHAYFNLAGAGAGTVLDSVAFIDADRYTPVDQTLIPTGEIREVKGTPFDFTEPTQIGANVRNDHEQLKHAESSHGGYDLNWVLNHPGDLSALAVRVTDPKSGRTVEMYTTEPAVQFYSGNFLDGTLTGKNGLTYPHWGAFTLEAQHYPDSINQGHFPTTVLSPGDRYAQTTIYKFLAT
jgi:aldose 1-epimerase